MNAENALWDKNSWRWGKMEYKTIQEQRDEERVFCSTKCKNNFLKTNKLNQNGKSQN